MTRGTRGYCIEVPVAVFVMGVAWTIASTCIGYVILVGGDEDGRVKTLGFFMGMVAIAATACRASWKTRTMLSEAYDLGRQDGARSEVVELSRR